MTKKMSLHCETVAVWALSVLTLLPVWNRASAQGLKDDGKVIAEEMLIDDMLNAPGASGTTARNDLPGESAAPASGSAEEGSLEDAVSAILAEAAPTGGAEVVEEKGLEIDELLRAEPLPVIAEEPAEDLERPAPKPGVGAKIDETSLESILDELEAKRPAAAVAEEPAAEAAVSTEEPAAEPVVATEEPAAEATVSTEEPAAEATVSTEEPAAEATVEPPPVALVVGGDEMQRVIQEISEGERLRRTAYRQHALEKIGEARAAFKARRYLDAKSAYEQVLSTLAQVGDQEDTSALRDAAKEELRETIYRQASAYMEGGDLALAKQFAREATFLGHRKGPGMIEQIELREKQPPPPPPPPKPRWKQEDYQQARKTILDRMKQGREFYMSNELGKALTAFESVLNDDPYNSEAIRWRAKVAQKQQELATIEVESTRRDMIGDVRRAWNAQDYSPEPGALPDRQDIEMRIGEEAKTRIEVLQKMELIRIPELDFRQANIQDVIGFLQEASVQHDRQADPSMKKGVNIILHIGQTEASAAAPTAPATGFFGAAEPAKGGGGAGDIPLITFKARDITLLEALKIVTEVANLKYRVEGRVVMIVPMNAPEGKIIPRMYDVLPTVRERIGVVSGDISRGGDGGGFPPIGAVGGAEPDQTNWKEFFRELGVEWPTGSSIKYIPAIAKIMVANTADNLAIFEQRLAALNVTPKQIEIEARFVEIAQTDLSSIGFEYILTDDWELAQKKGSSGTFLGGKERIQMNAGAFTSGNRYLTDNLLVADALAASDNIVTIASVLTNPELTVVMHMLQQKGNADLLSAPKVTTQSGMEAMIKVVTEYIYPSDYDITPGVAPTLNADGTVQSAGTPPVVTPQDFETREVGVILSVLPEVSAEGQMINLTMTPEVVTEPEWKNYGQTYTDASGNILQIPLEQPFFHTRSISTSISIYNGATVVMGGMITENRTEVDDKIPLLGDLPLVGRLFRSRYENSEKRNLLIFVTARLVDPAGRPVAPQEVMSQMSGGQE